MAIVAPPASVLLPLYRGEHSMPPLLERFESVLRGLRQGPELVLVDDGSPDGTGAIPLAPHYPYPVIVVHLARNFGQHPALAGFEHCCGDVVVTMDTHVQYAPKETPRLVDERCSQELEPEVGRETSAMPGARLIEKRRRRRIARSVRTGGRDRRSRSCPRPRSAPSQSS
jgi:glycosyltransferase involved in cell wall biosynthesis